MAIAYIFRFLVLRVDFGLVSGAVKDSGLGIRVFRLLQVPSKVPSGLMQVEAGGLFSGLGLVLGDFSPQFLAGRLSGGLVFGGDA